jgi:hypothetical protein
MPARAQRAADDLERARDAIRDGAWNDAARFARRALAGASAAEGHEILGLASWWLSDADTLFDSRELPVNVRRAA